MYMPTKSGCQEEEKRLPAKIDYQPKLATSQEWMPANKRQDRNGCQNCRTEKSEYQPKLAASQKQLPAKCQCKPKAADSQTWLPAKNRAVQA